MLLGNIINDQPLLEEALLVGLLEEPAVLTMSANRPFDQVLGNQLRPLAGLFLRRSIIYPRVLYV
jgi:hypothetical protein